MGNLFLILLTSSNSDHYSMILSGNGSEFICNCWPGSARSWARQKNILQYCMYRQHVIKINFFPFENSHAAHMPVLSSKPNFVYQPSTEIGKNIDRNRYSTLSCKKIVKDTLIRRFSMAIPMWLILGMAQWTKTVWMYILNFCHSLTKKIST